MAEIVKTGFSDFVLTLSENVIKKIAWDKYYYVKGSSDRIPARKMAGVAEIVAICLMEEYGCLIQEEELVRNCESVLFQIFCYAPESVVSAKMKKIVTEILGENTYSDYSQTIDYIRKKYGKWLADMEFAKPSENFDYKGAYDRFISEDAKKLIHWEEIQKKADELGLGIRIEKPDLTISSVTDKFFENQENCIREKYGDYETIHEKELYEAFSQLERIPCRTVYVDRLIKNIETVIDENGKIKWQEKLEQFKKAIADKQLSSGRIFFGDNSTKAEQVEKSFVNSGKFEYIMLINDTSRRLNGKSGMVVTTERIYYHGLLTSGDIPVKQISHFEFTGKTFSQGLAVYTLKGKKIFVPCDVGHTEQLKYLKVLDVLLKILKGTKIEEN
ncbi:MAG: hypothetical protein SPF70_11410 [Lachnospiraceae bacterium]|nr:hypothetical protein [Lachnospiraceae bacterium]